MHVKGKLVLVTGASSGIGEATARSLAALGARPILVARSADRLKAIVEQIKAQVGNAHAITADLARPEDVSRMADQVRHEAGVPDVLINNAGAGRWLSVLETTPQEARSMIELPYLAAFYTTRAFLPAMMARRSGHIVKCGPRCSVCCSQWKPSHPAWALARDLRVLGAVSIAFDLRLSIT